MIQNREYPGNLPLLPMGWGAANLDFDGAEDFWQEAKRVAGSSSLGESLDAAMAGESSPRIWLLLHEPGQGALSTAAALAFAQELGNRDQAVLILDCDDTDSQLTRWAGRHESEGLIDLVRYGASVLTSGVALPFSGRRSYILGVGSFTPTDIETHEAEDLILRLKRQADDLILVAPANVAGQIWAKMADIRLLCWDRARKSPDLIERVCTAFSSAGYGLTGLIGFGLPDEGLSLSAASEVVAPPTEPVSEAEEDYLEDDTDERFEAADLEDVDYDESEELDDLAESAEGLEVGEEAAGGAQEDDAAPEIDDEPLEPEAFVAEPGSGSSRVFWGAALVSLALIIVVSVYYLKVVRPEEGATPVGSPVVAQQQVQVEDTVPVEPKAEEPIQEKALESAPDQSASPATDQQLTTGESASEAGADLAQEPPVQTELQPEAAPVVAAPPPVEEKAVAEKGPVFTMDPYLQPVGSDGWALHLYSFPDSLLAVGESQRLERKGFQTAIHAVELPEKGRWYRVYVGSFLTRAEALEARDPLLKKLKTDWARATEF